MKSSKLKAKKELAVRLSEAWDDNEEYMGEQAAYLVSCDQLGIDPDEGYELLALIGTPAKAPIQLTNTSSDLREINER